MNDGAVGDTGASRCAHLAPGAMAAYSCVAGGGVAGRVSPQWLSAALSVLVILAA
jgi:hypothetical protein